MHLMKIMTFRIYVKTQLSSFNGNSNRSLDTDEKSENLTLLISPKTTFWKLYTLVLFIYKKSVSGKKTEGGGAGICNAVLHYSATGANQWSQD
jgi:hypothetical protein